MKRALVTGATGFIGGFIVDELLSHQYHVTAVVRATSDKSRLQNKNIQFIELAWNNEVQLAEQLGMAGIFDLIIHNAGLTKALNQNEYNKVNVENTKNFVEAIQKSNCLAGRFVFVSSLAALGSAPDGVERVFEDQEPKPLTPYGQSKLDAEKYLKSKSFDWIIVRPTAVYGPWERDILTFIKAVKTGFVFQIGSSEQQLSFIHGLDVAKSIVLLANEEKAKQRIFTLSDGRDYSPSVLQKAVVEALETKVILSVTLPKFVIYPLAGLAEIIGKLRGIASPLNRLKIAELTAKNWLADNTWQSEFGFEAKFDLASGMKNAVEWYKQNGWL